MERQICTLISEELFKKIKHLQAEKLVTIKSLLEEAFIDLIKKYESQTNINE